MTHEHPPLGNPPVDGEAQARLLRAIDTKIGEVRTEAIDLSFGEIINLKRENEIQINPEYQRLFRWSEEQKSRLVESVLLGYDFPHLFHRERGRSIRADRWPTACELHGSVY